MEKRTNKSLPGFRTYMAMAERFCLTEGQKIVLVDLLNDPIMDGTSSDIVKVAAHVNKVRAHYGITRIAFDIAFEQELTKVDGQLLVESN